MDSIEAESVALIISIRKSLFSTVGTYRRKEEEWRHKEVLAKNAHNCPRCPQRWWWTFVCLCPLWEWVQHCIFDYRLAVHYVQYNIVYWHVYWHQSFYRGTNIYPLRWLSRGKLSWMQQGRVLMLMKWRKQTCTYRKAGTCTQKRRQLERGEIDLSW